MDAPQIESITITFKDVGDKVFLADGTAQDGAFLILLDEHDNLLEMYNNDNIEKVVFNYGVQTKTNLQ